MRNLTSFILLTFFYSTAFLSCNSVDIIYPDGGYDYPKSLNNIDTNNYCFPIAHLIGARDSFDQSFYGHYWAKAYNEPNLSLKPFGKDIFRLTYETAFGGSAVFTLTDDKIVVKELISGSPYPERDLTKLSKLEKEHYFILRYNFPLQNAISSDTTKNSLDSLVKLYPKLLDPNYYKQLLEKSAVLPKETFIYSTHIVNISKEEFRKIVTLINASGFWKLPYRNKCDHEFMDGFGFILEANTSKKYNLVNINCPGDRSDFVKACQQIIIAANYDKKIKLYDDRKSK